MLLSDIYSKRQVKKATGWKQAKYFFKNPDTHYRFDLLNEIDWPSISDIRAFQLENAKQIKESQSATAILQAINKDFFGDLEDFSLLVEKNIQDIEETLSFDKGIGVLYKKENNIGTKEITAQELSSLLSIHKTLVQRLKTLYGQITTTSLKTSANTIEAFKTFEQALSHLLEDVNRLAEVPQHFVFKDRGYLNSLRWAEWVLKGQQLENLGTDFLKERLPSKIVVNTGAIKAVSYDLLGNIKSKGTSIIEDIMIFDETEVNKSLITIDYQIGGVQKNNVPIGKFLKEIQDNQGTLSIRLTEESYEKLRSLVIAAVSAKSGAFKFKKITLNEITEVRDNMGIVFALKSLMLLVDKNGPYQSKRILGTSLLYDSLFNYILGRNLTKIIGNQNTLMLTRKGFSTTKNFLIEKFEEGYIMSNYRKQDVNIRNAKKQIQVGLKKV